MQTRSPFTLTQTNPLPVPEKTMNSIKADLKNLTLTVVDNDGTDRRMDIDSHEAFQVLSELWLRSGWANKYSYTFSWMGRPIIQIPEDMVRIQEIIYQLKPDVIVETGIAHGGSLIFYASLCKLMGKGKVVGIDIDIRAHNRTAIESHELSPLITLIEASSTEPTTHAKVKTLISSQDKVLVVLDSCHTKAHVERELEMYSAIVTPGSYILVADGIMERVVGAPGSQADWGSNNPKKAVEEFISSHPDFELVATPEFPFNESEINNWSSYFIGGILRRCK